MDYEAAVSYEGIDELRIRTVSAGALRPDELLVKLTACGICHTDLTVHGGGFPVPRPIILGHEGSGIVAETGSAVTDIRPGDAVALTFMSCGNCRKCLAGQPAYCEHFAGLNMSGLRADGSSAIQLDDAPLGGHFFGQSSFARYSVANRRNAVKVRKEAPLEVVAPFGCGIQTGAGAIFNVLRPGRNDSVVVIGTGGVGLSAIMAAAVLGCDPIVAVELRAARRQLALEVGATASIDPGQGALSEQIIAATGGGADVIVDTTGIPAVISQAIAALCKKGALGIIGLHAMADQVSFAVLEAISKGFSIHGIVEGDSNPDVFIPYLVDLYLEGKFPVDKMMRVYPFESINQAFADQHSGAVIKPVLRF